MNTLNLLDIWTNQWKNLGFKTRYEAFNDSEELCFKLQRETYTVIISIQLNSDEIRTYATIEDNEENEIGEPLRAVFFSQLVDFYQLRCQSSMDLFETSPIDFLMTLAKEFNEKSGEFTVMGDEDSFEDYIFWTKESMEFKLHILGQYQMRSVRVISNDEEMQ